MMRRIPGLEIIAAAAVFLTILGLPLAVFAYQRVIRPALHPDDVMLIALRVERGGWTPGEIVVKKGRRVRLVVASHDVTHALAIPAFGVRSDPIPGGGIRVVEFVPDRVGRFPFRCAVICSPLHGDMEGELVVEP